MYSNSEVGSVLLGSGKRACQDLVKDLPIIFRNFSNTAIHYSYGGKTGILHLKGGRILKDGQILD